VRSTAGIDYFHHVGVFDPVDLPHRRSAPAATKDVSFDGLRMKLPSQPRLLSRACFPRSAAC
jgi:hypothetical protein